jgi:dephospho-CoA kinase
MIKIGITGGIGSGKSMVCKIFQCLNTPVYYADIEAQKLINSNQEIIKELTETFGNEIYLKDKTLNKPLMAKLIFGNSENLKKVNSVVHPKIKADFNKWAEKQSCKYVIEEAAVLLENNNEHGLDYVVTVYSSEELRIKRVKKRDDISEEEIIKRMQSQLSEEEKLKLADFIIYNNDKDLLIPQVIKLHKIFNK